jgi:ornithine cyclodeaminase
MRYLSNEDVAACLSWDTALDSLDAAFRAFAEGRAAIAPRARLSAGRAKLSTLVAVLPELGVMGAKVYSTAAGGRFRFLVVLFDSDAGEPLALLSADALTRIRTAAVSVIAARALASSAPRVLTVFGAGVQARAHAEAFAREYALDEVRVVHRRPTPELADDFAAETGVRPTVGDDAAAALDGADLVVLATRAAEPLFDGGLLAPGAHVTAVGATRPEVRELDEHAIGRCGPVVVEWVPQVRGEAGDLIAAADQGHFAWDDAVELGDVLVGSRPGRRQAEDITLFKSVGVALEDVAVAGAVYDAAVADGRGIELG